MALQFLSINVNGLRDVSKRAGFLQWLRSLPVLPDIVSIQEAHCVSVDECRSWFSSSGFSFVLSPGSNRSCGCIVLFRSSLLCVRVGVIMPGVMFSVSFLLVVKFFVLFVCMLPIITLKGIDSSITSL